MDGTNVVDRCWRGGRFGFGTASGIRIAASNPPDPCAGWLHAWPAPRTRKFDSKVIRQIFPLNYAANEHH